MSWTACSSEGIVRAYEQTSTQINKQINNVESR